MNSGVKHLKSRIISIMAITIAVAALLDFGFLFVVDVLFQVPLSKYLYGSYPSVYYFFVNNKDTLVIVFLLLTLGIGLRIAFKRIFRQLDVVFNSLERVFERDESLIELPSDYKDIESSLNSAKFEMMRSKQLAREAEQRKNDLVVYLAHDLKTPLTSVIGYLNLLNDESGISPELRQRYLAIALRKSERLEDLLNEFFEITRFNMQDIELEHSKLDLNLMLSQLVDEFYPVFSAAGLHCILSAEPDLLVNADADKLARVFDNLLRNAVNYSEKGSIIQVDAKRGSDGVSISFKNHGSIPEEKLNRIFEKFYRLDASRSTASGGAGLGLAISRQIVELHHGSISAQSSGGLTVFTVTLPAYST